MNLDLKSVFFSSSLAYHLGFSLRPENASPTWSLSSLSRDSPVYTRAASHGFLGCAWITPGRTTHVGCGVSGSSRALCLLHVVVTSWQLCLWKILPVGKGTLLFLYLLHVDIFHTSILCGVNPLSQDGGWQCPLWSCLFSKLNISSYFHNSLRALS